MTRIKDWFITMRVKKLGLLRRNESVSFDAFTDDTEDTQKIQESSITQKTNFTSSEKCKVYHLL